MINDLRIDKNCILEIEELEESVKIKSDKLNGMVFYINENNYINIRI